MNPLPPQCLRDQSLPFRKAVGVSIHPAVCDSSNGEKKEQAEFGRVTLPFAPLPVQTSNYECCISAMSNEDCAVPDDSFLESACSFEVFH